MKEKTNFVRFYIDFSLPMICYFKFITLRIVVIFLVGWAFQGEVNAQILYPVTYSTSQEFRFHANARQESSLAVNELLQILSEGAGKLRVFTSYTLQANLEAEIALNDNDTLDVFFEDLQVDLIGDTYFRDFSLKPYLLPPFADIVFVLKSHEGNIITEVQVDGIRWQNLSADELIHSFKLVNGDSKDLNTVYIKEAEFHYGEHYLEKADELGKALHSYYLSKMQISTTDSILNSLDAQVFELAILNEFKLCDAEIVLSKICNKPFLHILPLQQNDPLLILPALNQLKQKITLLREDFNFVISQIDEMYFTKGKLFLLTDVDKAREYFNRALIFNPLHIPAHVELGTMELLQNNSLAVMERFEKILSVVQPPSQWNGVTKEFIAFLFEHEKDRARENMKDGRFLDALKILTQVEEFCNAIPFWECPEELYAHIKEVHYGMYGSYLSVARRAYQSANYSFAVNYIESALTYKKNNSNYITDDSEANNLLQAVLEGYYKLADTAFIRNDFGGAAKFLHEAIALCQLHSSLKCKTDAVELASKAEQMQQAAEKITMEVTVNDPQVSMPAISTAEARSLVEDLLSKGHLKAWAGEVADAKAILNEVIPYSTKYELRKDTIINDRIVSLSEMIVQKECELLEREVLALLASAHKYFHRSFYSEAKNSLGEARGLQTMSNACSWNYNDTLFSLTHIDKAAQYQALLYDAQGAYFNAGQEGFDQFIPLYKKAGNYHNENHLQQWGVSHSSLYEFAANSSNSALMKLVINDLSDRGLANEAISLLKILKEQGFDARQLRSLLEYAGSKAAVHVHASQPNIRPSDYLNEKFDDDPWFRQYSRSFMKNWPG